MISTVTTIAKPELHPRIWKDCPRFVRHLPGPLQSQAGLMIMAGLAVMVLMAVVYGVLSLAHVI